MIDAEALTPTQLRALADQIEASDCTGLTARWCSVHGDCACPGVDDDLDDPNCPLHSEQSSHATQPDRVTTEKETDHADSR